MPDHQHPPGLRKAVRRLLDRWVNGLLADGATPLLVIGLPFDAVEGDFPTDTVFVRAAKDCPLTKAEIADVLRQVADLMEKEKTREID